MKAYPPFVNFFEMSKETIVRCEKQKPRFHAFLKVWPFMLVYFCLSSGFHDIMSKKNKNWYIKKPNLIKFDRCLHPQSFDCLPLQILNLSEEVTLCPLAPVHLWLTRTLFNFYQNYDPSTWVLILRIWQATPSLQLAKSGEWVGWWGEDCIGMHKRLLLSLCTQHGAHLQFRLFPLNVHCHIPVDFAHYSRISCWQSDPRGQVHSAQRMLRGEKER